MTKYLVLFLYLVQIKNYVSRVFGVLYCILRLASVDYVNFPILEMSTTSDELHLFVIDKEVYFMPILEIYLTII